MKSWTIFHLNYENIKTDIILIWWAACENLLRISGKSSYKMFVWAVLATAHYPSYFWINNLSYRVWCFNQIWMCWSANFWFIHVNVDNDLLWIKLKIMKICWKLSSLTLSKVLRKWSVITFVPFRANLFNNFSQSCSVWIGGSSKLYLSWASRGPPCITFKAVST